MEIVIIISGIAMIITALLMKLVIYYETKMRMLSRDRI